MILAYAVLVDDRINAAQAGEVGVLGISFLKSLEASRGLWQFFQVSADMLSPKGVRLIVRRMFSQLADTPVPNGACLPAPAPIANLSAVGLGCEKAPTAAGRFVKPKKDDGTA